MRKPRFEIPGIPLHVTQRGINRRDVFLDDRDRYAYLNALETCSERMGVAVHGYVLMSNHVHLVASSPHEGAVSRLMQAVGAAYVPRFNHRWQRTGPLWEGRFRSCLVDSDRYLLNCLAYVELNPVRAGMVRQAEAHPWSSARHHLGLWPDPRVASHPVFLSLENDSLQRAARWRGVLAELSSLAAVERIRRDLHGGLAYGSQAFRTLVDNRYGRPRGRSGRGRVTDV